jgi:translocation and assembly module TamB
MGHALRWVALLLATAIVFLLSTAAGAAIHLGLPSLRRFAARETTQALAGVFEGTIEITRIDRLGIGGASGVRAVVRDPEGRVVLVAYDVSARLDSSALVRSLFSTRRDVEVLFTAIRVDDLEVIAIREADGSPSIAGAFATREREEPERRRRAKRGVEVEVRDVVLRHAWVHGELGRPIDLDVDDLHAGLRVAPKQTRASLSHAEVTARGIVPAEVHAVVAGAMEAPAEGGGTMRGEGRVDANAGALRATALGRIDGGVVDVDVDVPDTDGGAVRALFPSAPIFAPIAAHLEALGSLPQLTASAAVRVGAGAVDVEATGLFGDDPRVRAEVRAKNVDARSFAPNAPESRLSARMGATIDEKDGKARGTFEIVMEPSTVTRELLPVARALGRFGDRDLDAALVVEEPGARGNGHVHARKKGKSVIVSFDARAWAPDLRRARRLGGALEGSAEVRARGIFDSEAKGIDVRVGAKLGGVTTGSVRLSAATLDARARGTPDKLRLDAALTALGARAGGVTLDRADVKVAATSVGGTLWIHPSKLEVSRGDVRAALSVAAAKIGAGGFEARGVEVNGVGDLVRARARAAGGRWSVTLDAPDIDLARLGAVLGQRQWVRGGHVSLGADLAAHKASLSGRLAVNARDVSVVDLEHASASLYATAEDRVVAAAVVARLGDAGRFELRADRVCLGGCALLAGSWRTAVGEIDATLEGDIERVARQLRIPLPFDRVGGSVHIDAKAMREPSDPFFKLNAIARAKNIVLIGKPRKPQDTKVPLELGDEPWHVEGIDARLDASLDRNGDTHVAARIWDAAGTLLALDGAATAPLAAAARDARVLLDVPFRVHADVPERRLDRLPSILGRPPVRGSVTLAVDADGTAHNPRVQAHASTRACTTGGEPCDPIDADALFAYEAGAARAHLEARDHEQKVLDAAALVRVRAQDLLGTPVPWEADARVKLDGMPAEVFAPLMAAPVKGRLFGEARLDGLHKDAQAHAAVEGRDLSLGGVAFPRANATISLENGLLDAHASAHQKDGRAVASVSGGVRWEDRLAPLLDDTRPLDAALDAKNLRATVAQPFLAGALTELDGRVSADLRIHKSPGVADASMTGAVEILDGTFEVPSIGEEFHGAHAKVLMNPWGTLRFEDVHAEGTTGRVRASGSAQLKGVELVSAEASLTVPQDAKIPVTLEGVPLGYASVQADARARMRGDRKEVDVEVDVPHLHAELPSTSQHSVQKLDPDPTVAIGHRTLSGRLALLPLSPPQKPRSPDALRVLARVRLGDDVTIKRRDNSVDVVLSGSPEIAFDDQTRMTGQIRLVRGNLDVQGRRFVVDGGTVTFTGDPSAPTVLATAYWDAPDKTRVYADYVGPVPGGKITLRSEPAHTQNEIFALILFGSADGTFGASAPPGRQEGAAATAMGLGGGYVAQAVNRALEGVSPLPVSTRLETSEANNPRPELAIQIGKNVTAQVVYNMGLPPPGDNPDRTLLVVDWRFIRNWTLEATVGDRGSTITDLVWRYRY